MNNLIKLLVIAGFVIGMAAMVNYGGDLLGQQLSLMVEQSYGAVGDQLGTDQSCRGTQICPTAEVSQDMKQINTDFQRVMSATDSR